MKKLSIDSTAIFCALIERLHGGCFTEIENDPYMTLTIENISDRMETPFGVGKQYSLCHYYEQEGDLMQDPEMCFFMTDNRSGNETDFQNVSVIPYQFQQANTGAFQMSIIWQDKDNVSIYERMQADHTAFAEIWLTNIKDQGFLEVAE